MALGAPMDEAVRVNAMWIRVPAHWFCVCGHVGAFHNGPIYATGLGTEGPSCDLCECAYFATLTTNQEHYKLVMHEDDCDCPCHQSVQPGLVPCPQCDNHSSRYGSPEC